jgi:iron complex outermembrane receptor protein
MSETVYAGGLTGARISACGRALLVTTVFFVTYPALAQDLSETEKPSNPKLDEIVVTATKRAESLQDVPMSITAVDGKLIENLGIERLSQVAGFIPNVSIAPSDEPARNISIRGLGSGNNRGFETSVGLFLDGAYLGRELFLTDAFYDIQRIEAIKGPQGALFGKNTIAGAISVITNDPADQFRAMVRGSYGSQNKVQADAMVTGPLTDTLSGRVYIQYLNRDGFYTNTLTGKSTGGRSVFSVRGKLKWEPSADFDAKLTVSYSDSDQQGYGVQPGPSVPCISLISSTAPAGANGCAPGTVASLFSNFGTLSTVGVARLADASANGIPDKFVSFDADVVDKRSNLFISGLANYNIGRYILTYNGSYAGIYGSLGVLDADHTGLPINRLENSEEYRQHQHELRITSPTDQPVEFIAGAYYFWSKINARQMLSINQPFVGPPQGSVTGTIVQRTETFALFGQVTANLTDRLRVIGGLRYTDEQKKAPATQTVDPSLFIFPNYSVNLAFSDDATLLNGAIEFDLAKRVMLYASYTQGFKLGGLNFFALEGTNFTFGSEASDGYEAGIKSTILDGAATLNVAYFYTTFANLQTSTLVGNALVIANAASATSQGIEAELNWQLTNRLSMRASGAYLHARYGRFPNAPCTDQQNVNSVGPCSQNLSGGKLDGAADWTGAFNLTYQLPLPNFVGDASFSGDLIYSSSFFPYNSGTNNPAQYQSGYVTANGRIAIDSHDDRWSLALQGTNLFNRRTVISSGNAFQFPGSTFVNLAPLRQWSLVATHKW